MMRSATKGDLLKSYRKLSLGGAPGEDLNSTMSLKLIPSVQNDDIVKEDFEKSELIFKTF